MISIINSQLINIFNRQNIMKYYNEHNRETKWIIVGEGTGSQVFEDEVGCDGKSVHRKQE